jgi:hypothetical protein
MCHDGPAEGVERTVASRSLNPDVPGSATAADDNVVPDALGELHLVPIPGHVHVAGFMIAVSATKQHNHQDDRDESRSHEYGQHGCPFPGGTVDVCHP